MAKQKTVTLCADDYAISYAVSVGILEALDAGRLSAVSALTNGPRWPALGFELKQRAYDADIGLHFNLTLGCPLTIMPVFAPSAAFPPIAQIVKRAFRHKLPLDEIRGEFDAQLDRFEAVMGRPPDFLDGHQHVHVLPDVRDVVFDALEARGLTKRLWLRDSGDAFYRIISRGSEVSKALTVRGLAAGFRRTALARGFRLNNGFSGFSGFNPGHSYKKQFAGFLRAVGRHHLIMCHPGHVDEDLRQLDPVTVTREQELAFILSPAFTDMLAARRLSLTRLGGQT
jgi:predicted glycoside hydrolase/deacetylase ChbG (UPF0249 family)